MIITINGQEKCGRIKPMHGVNNVPFTPQDYGDSGLFRKLQEAGIPFSRLHDTGGDWGGAHYVDIANVFPDFNADPDRIENYDFAFTDKLMEEIVKHGMEPFYRLGCSIENLHRIKAYNIYPPEDNLQWARICEGIIRHYTQGWGNGYYYKIRYWEIWNEPDNMPEPMENPMWRGTMEQYFALYETAACYLKKRFPELKIGGYSSCGFYYLSSSDYSQRAHSSSRVGYFVEFFHKFLEHITSTEHRAPLDFFSFHSYADIEENVQYAAYARAELDKAGLQATELIFNEWNAGPPMRGTCEDAARIAAMMCALQNTAIDACMYYDAQVGSSYCGLFNPVGRKIFKAYYAFKAFNELYRLQEQVGMSGLDDKTYGLATWNGQEGAALLVNLCGQEENIRLEILPMTDEARKQAVLAAVDESHEYEKIEICAESDRTYTFTAAPYGIYLLRY